MAQHKWKLNKVLSDILLCQSSETYKYQSRRKSTLLFTKLCLHTLLALQSYETRVSIKVCWEGFDDWKHASNELIGHEENTVHKKAINNLFAWNKKGEHVGSLVLKQTDSE